MIWGVGFRGFKKREQTVWPKLRAARRRDRKQMPRPEEFFRNRGRVSHPGLALVFTGVLCACAQTDPGAATQPALASFTLVDALSRAPIPTFDPLRDGSTLNLASLPGRPLEVRANPASESVGSVRFSFEREERLDNGRPFEFAASDPWLPPVGSHKLTATPYPRTNAQGAAGAPLSVAFHVIDDKNAAADDPLGTGTLPTLLASYYVWDYTTAWQRSTETMIYRPWQFSQAPYRGWDMLTVPGEYFLSYTRSDWLNLELSRPATLAVLWDGPGLATWLNDWLEVAPVDGTRVFTRSFPAGPVTLGAGEGATTTPYTVLFAEADGTPTAPPTVPAGLSRPEANAPCPSWVHDQYLARGFDGKMYRTWHPQIDPTYWCYLEHSHGSDPALFSGASPVTFDYYADKGHRIEPHEGFKVFVVNSADYSMRFTVHLGSSEGGRICARVHTYDVAVAERETGEMLADLRLKSDFGITLAVDQGSVYYRLRDAACPEMSALPETTGGRIRIPIAGTDGYESWSPNMLDDVLGISNPPVLIIDNPITKVTVARNPDGSVKVGQHGAADYTGLQDTGDLGERLWMSFPGANRGNGFAIKAAAASATGEFFTDYRGQRLLERSDPLAVRQYLKPGLDFLFINGTMVFTQDAWHGTYEFGEVQLLRVNMNLENGLSGPN